MGRAASLEASMAGPAGVIGSDRLGSVLSVTFAFFEVFFDFDFFCGVFSSEVGAGSSKSSKIPPSE
jgi:hypothetical protein